MSSLQEPFNKGQGWCHVAGDTGTSAESIKDLKSVWLLVKYQRNDSGQVRYEEVSESKLKILAETFESIVIGVRSLLEDLQGGSRRNAAVRSGAGGSLQLPSRGLSLAGTAPSSLCSPQAAGGGDGELLCPAHCLSCVQLLPCCHFGNVSLS